MQKMQRKNSLSKVKRKQLPVVKKVQLHLKVTVSQSQGLRRGVKTQSIFHDRFEIF